MESNLPFANKVFSRWWIPGSCITCRRKKSGSSVSIICSTLVLMRMQVLYSAVPDGEVRLVNSYSFGSVAQSSGKSQSRLGRNYPFFCFFCFSATRAGMTFSFPVRKEKFDKNVLHGCSMARWAEPRLSVLYGPLPHDSVSALVCRGHLLLPLLLLDQTFLSFFLLPVLSFIPSGEQSQSCLEQCCPKSDNLLRPVLPTFLPSRHSLFQQSASHEAIQTADEPTSSSIIPFCHDNSRSRVGTAGGRQRRRGLRHLRAEVFASRQSVLLLSYSRNGIFRSISPNIHAPKTKQKI